MDWQKSLSINYHLFFRVRVTRTKLVPLASRPYFFLDSLHIAIQDPVAHAMLCALQK